MTATAKMMMHATRAPAPRVTPLQASIMIADGNALVLDMRDAHEIEESGSIPGAVHVSHSMLAVCADPEAPEFDQRFGPDTPLILYCASGERSARGADLLKAMGYRRVYNLGPFKDWVERGWPVK